MLENNPAGLDRAEIERVVGNQYNSLLRQQHDSKALSASGSTTTADRGKKKRKSRKRFGAIASTAEERVTALRMAGAQRRRSKNREMAADKKGGGRESATSVGVRRTLSINTVACAETWSTELAIVRSEKLRRMRY